MWINPLPYDLPAHHEALMAQLRLEIHGRPAVATERRTLRHWLGRQLVRVGTRLAADPSMRPVRSL